MKCQSPNVTSWLVEETSRSKRATDDPQHKRISAYVGFNLDGVLAYRNLTEAMPNYGPMEIYPDPVIYTFTQPGKVKDVLLPATTLEFEVLY